MTHTCTRRDAIACMVWLGAARTARGWEAALPVIGLDHVNIRVPDVRRAGEFYAKLFGREVSRASNAFASAGSRRGELWFVRLGQSSLAISPAAPDEKPGMDHFCFAVEGFNAGAMRQSVAGLNLQVDRSDPPGNNLWTKDPAGHLIQLSAPQNPSRAPELAASPSRRRAAPSANLRFKSHELPSLCWPCLNSNHPRATTASFWAARRSSRGRRASGWDHRNCYWDRPPVESIFVWE